MLEIQSSKIVLTLVDTETGELFTKEATFGDFKEATKKSTTTRIKKPKDNDPTPKITLLEGKWQMNAACVELTGFEPEMKLDIKFEKKGRLTTPILCQDDKTGNRLTKTYTVSCRGSKHDNLAEYGDVFVIEPYEGRDGYFKLKGNIEKEDDIIDVPEEITDPEKFDEDLDSSDDTTDVDDFELEL